MLFYVQMKWNYQGRVSQDGLWALESKEGDHAESQTGASKDTVRVVNIFKAASQHRVIAIVDADSADELDRNSMGRLPMKEYLEFEHVWPLREYDSFIRDVKSGFKPGAETKPVPGTREIINTWFTALRQSDFDTLFSLIDENIHWKNSTIVPGVNDVVPWLGTFHGAEEVKKSFEIFGKYSQNQEMTLGAACVDGDTALVWGYETNRIIQTGLIYHANVIWRMKTANGKVTEWEAFWDPSEAAAAINGTNSPGGFEGMGFADILSESKKLSAGELKSLVSPKIALRWENGMTLLMLASGYGIEDLVDALIAAGADVNAVDKFAGAASIHKACQGGHLSILKKLLAAGAFINATVYTTGHTPLVEAAWYKMVDCAEYLLASNANTEIRTNYGFTFNEHIEYALKVNQSPSEKEKLIRIQSALAQRRKSDTETQQTGIIKAVSSDDCGMAGKILESGGSAEARFPITGTLDDGGTPLLVSARKNAVDMTGLLLRHSADANAKEPVFGAVSLHKATYNGNYEILKLLLKQRDIDINAVGYTNGYTPLHDALWHGFEKCADALVDVGARVDIRGHDGKLPIDVSDEVFGAGSPLSDKIRKKTQHGK
jgi:ankyrin repeat protein/ketosteroid isomerase-like protein/muconolactone delta-isomerase